MSKQPLEKSPLNKLPGTDVTEEEPFSMKIEQAQREIEIVIQCKNPADLVVIAGFVLNAMQKTLDVEPTVKVLSP